MIKDLLVSFSDNFKEKTRNPFLGTYVLIWFIRNWELVYSLFNFDSSLKLEDKILFIKNFYETNSFLNGIFANLLLTFLVLIVTYLVLNISRIIVNLSEKQLKPWVYKKTDSKSIVLKSTHEQVRNERDILQTRLDSERESKSKLEIRIKYLEDEIVKTRELKNVQNSKNQQSTNIVKSKINAPEILTEKMIKLKILESFIKIGVSINKNKYIHNDMSNLDKFIEFGLITHKEDSYGGDSALFNLTEDGKEVLKLARLRK